MLISGVPGLMSGAGGVIRSVQQVTIVIAAGATSNTATISSVVTANSVRFYGGAKGPVTTVLWTTCLAGLTLTNSTTVTATRNTSDASNALTVSGTIFEFQSGVLKSVQDGTITMTAATSNTATITAVTTANSVPIFGGSTSTNAGASLAVGYGTVVLTNSTTVTATRTTGTNNLTVYYTVMEFNSGILNSSTQAVASTMTLAGSQTLVSSTITGVTASQAMLVHGGIIVSDGSLTTDANSLPWVTLANGTTINSTRTAAGITTLTTNLTVLEFKSTAIKSVNRGPIVIAANATSNTATVSSVDTTKTIANYLGFTSAGSVSASFNKEMPSIVLTNGTTVTAATNTADASNTRTVGYETIEFL